MQTNVPDEFNCAGDRRPSWTIARFAVGGVFFVAAVLKLVHMVNGGSDESLFQAFAPRSTLCITILEGLLACWLFAGWRPVHLWQMTLLVCAGMMSVGVYEVANGRSSCGCFGVVSVDPRVSLAVSSLLFLTLLIRRPGEAKATVNEASSRRRWMMTCAWAGCVLVFATAICVVPSPGFLGWLRGEAVVSLPTVSRISAKQPGESMQLSLQLANISRRPITILGMERGCHCRSASGLPVAIPVEGEVQIAVSFKAPTSLGKFSDAAIFYTNDARQPYVVCRIVGEIR